MRARLTVAFVVVAVALCLLAFAVRSYSLQGSISRDESEEVHQAATAIAAAVRLQRARGGRVDEAFLSRIVGEDQRVAVHWQDTSGADVVAEGPDFTGAEDVSRSDDTWATADVPGGVVMVSQSADVVDAILFGRAWRVVAFFGLLALLAGVVGYLLARALARPFRQVASAASALGRGRFDIDLPRTSVPEAREIAQALRTSAAQLQDRIAQERSFAQEASHLLRTPLTSMRLELDDLALDKELPPEVRRTIERCVKRIDELDTVSGELVGMARRSHGLPGVGVPLRDLATSCAQRWADQLAGHDRTLTAAVEGDLDATFTPGPLEHIHELLLDDVLQRSRGPVRLVYESDEAGGLLRMRVLAGEPARTRVRGRLGLPSGRRRQGASLARAQAVVTALGGRLEGEYHERGLDIVLPRR